MDKDKFLAWCRLVIFFVYLKIILNVVSQSKGCGFHYIKTSLESKLLLNDIF